MSQTKTRGLPEQTATLKRVGVYARVSNIERQTGENKGSIDDQVKDSRELGEKVGGVLVGNYVDAERYRVGKKMVDPSGWRADRPQWLRLFEDVRSGKINLIIAWRMDRLVRGLKTTALLDDLLDETGVDIMLVHGVFDKAKLGFDAAMSRHELSAIKDRTDGGRRRRVRRGLRATDKLPFGYTICKDKNGDTTGYELDEKRAVMLREMAKLFVAGRGYSDITGRMGIDPTTKQNWTLSKIYRILRNPWYHGRVIYKPDGTEGQGAHELPWDEKLRKAVLDEIKRRSRTGTAPRKLTTIFTGILFCGLCSGPMVAQGTNRYRCSRRQSQLQHKTNNHPESLHGPNHISNKAAKQQVAELISSWTPADVDAYLKTVTPVVADSERTYWLAEQVAELETKAGQLKQSLDLPLPDAARLAVASEYEKASAQLEQKRADLRKTESDTQPTLENFRAEILDLIREPNKAFDGSPDKIRAKLRAAFPAIFVRHGILVFKNSNN